jgi:hypothetical protein
VSFWKASMAEGSSLDLAESDQKSGSDSRLWQKLPPQGWGGGKLSGLKGAVLLRSRRLKMLVVVGNQKGEFFCLWYFISSGRWSLCPRRWNSRQGFTALRIWNHTYVYKGAGTCLCPRCEAAGWRPDLLPPPLPGSQ